jgi:choline dehydrogenase
MSAATPAITTIGRSGATGWAYADVLPYFKRMENWHDGGHGGDPAWRGKSGPLHVTRGKRDNPLFHAAFAKRAGRQALSVTPDYNGEKQEGFGPMEHDGVARPPLVRRQCLSETRPEAAELHTVRGFVRRITFNGQPRHRASRSNAAAASRRLRHAAKSWSPPPRSTRRKS